MHPIRQNSDTLDKAPFELVLAKQHTTGQGRPENILMAFNDPALLFVALLAASELCCHASAATHVVGDAMGWTIPGSASDYPNWASRRRFRVGDTLLFNFPTGSHDVARVPKTSYDGCSSNGVIGQLETVGPASFALNATGEHYYICTFNQHCSLGQKLAVNVVGGASGTPPGTPTPTPTPAPPTRSPLPAPPTPSPTVSPRAPSVPGRSPSPSPSPTSAPPSPAPTPSGTSPPSPSPAPTPSGTSPPSPSSSPSGAPPGSAPGSATPRGGSGSPPSPGPGSSEGGNPPPPGSSAVKKTTGAFAMIYVSILYWLMI